MYLVLFLGKVQHYLLVERRLQLHQHDELYVRPSLLANDSG